MYVYSKFSKNVLQNAYFFFTFPHTAGLCLSPGRGLGCPDPTLNHSQCGGHVFKQHRGPRDLSHLPAECTSYSYLPALCYLSARGDDQRPWNMSSLALSPAPCFFGLPLCNGIKWGAGIKAYVVYTINFEEYNQIQFILYRETSLIRTPCNKDKDFSISYRIFQWGWEGCCMWSHAPLGGGGGGGGGGVWRHDAPPGIYNVDTLRLLLGFQN